MIKDKENLIEYLKKVKSIFKPYELDIIISLIKNDCKINLKALQDGLFPSLSKPSLKVSFSKFKKKFNEIADKNDIGIILNTNNTSKKIENNFCFFEYSEEYSNKVKDKYKKDSLKPLNHDEFIPPTAQNENEKKIFVSFAFKNNEEVQLLVKKLEKYLGIIDKSIKITFWKCDSKLLVGENIKEGVENAINECEFALLALSSDFLASDFIQKYELPRFINNSPKYPIPVFIQSVDIRYDSMKDFFNHLIIKIRTNMPRN